ncbi:MAG TPA: UPF0280 family protein [Syntrophales bacterium]|nr:UPF0280 family protein [Syntrophales bacterium]HPQ44833.1 UPF0280 family protein [Syntrophales bacterium]
MKYQKRTYRNRISKKDLVSFQVTIKETDLYIGADIDCKDPAVQSVHKHRESIEQYIRHNPSFLNSMIPVRVDAFAPSIIREMIEASVHCGVGPMASVAGAIARNVGLDLLKYSDNIIIENGGDIFLLLQHKDIIVGIFAGDSPVSYKVGIKIPCLGFPVGVCTSSGTVGHSLSLGKADAVCVISESSTLSDAAATSICNRVQRVGDIKSALDFGLHIEGITGVLIIMGDKLGMLGDIELISLN